MPKPLNLVFDLDGTLIDSAPEIHAAANKAFCAKGLQPLSLDLVRGFIGNGLPTLVARLLQHQALATDGPLHEDLVDDIVKIYEEAFDLTTLYPNVPTALAELRSAGHALAICTNKPERPARAVLRHFGLGHIFPVVIGGDSLPRRKPDPLPLLAARDALGDRPTLFVGDSEVDAETARNAGLPLAAFTQGYRKTAVESWGARVIFDDFAALPRLVAHLAPKL